MSLCGAMSGQTEIKYCTGDAFYQLLRYKPNDLSNVIPHIVQSCSLQQGEWGTEGSIIVWNFVHEGETEVQKELVEAVDEEKRSVTFKVIEGFILEMYKSFKGTFQVDIKGVKTVVTWTLEYEKLNPDVSDPQTFFDLHFKVTTDIDDYYKSVQK